MICRGLCPRKSQFSSEFRVSRSELLGGTPAPDYIIGERNGRFLNSTRGRSSPSTVLPLIAFGGASPWRTNRRFLFTSSSAGESERILFPSVPSRQPSNQGDKARKVFAQRYSFFAKRAIYCFAMRYAFGAICTRGRVRFGLLAQALRQ